jgi:hypothetical protein
VRKPIAVLGSALWDPLPPNRHRRRRQTSFARSHPWGKGASRGGPGPLGPRPSPHAAAGPRHRPGARGRGRGRSRKSLRPGSHERAPHFTRTSGRKTTRRSTGSSSTTTPSPLTSWKRPAAATLSLSPPRSESPRGRLAADLHAFYGGQCPCWRCRMAC